MNHLVVVLAREGFADACDSLELNDVLRIAGLQEEAVSPSKKQRPLPSRFNNADAFDRQVPEQHPCYTTSNYTIGKKAPKNVRH